MINTNEENSQLYKIKHMLSIEFTKNFSIEHTIV